MANGGRHRATGPVDLSPTAFLVSDCEQVYISGWGGETNANSGTGDVSGSTTFGLPTSRRAPSRRAPTEATSTSPCSLPTPGPRLRHLLRRTLRQRARRRRLLAVRPEWNGLPAVCAGCGGMNDFPSTPGAWSPNNPSPNCNMGSSNSNSASSMPTSPSTARTNSARARASVRETALPGPAAFTWDFGDANFSNEVAPLHLYGLNGVFEVEVIAEDTTGCLEPDTAYVTVTIAPNADPVVEPVDPLCLGGIRPTRWVGQRRTQLVPPCGPLGG